MRSDFWTGLAVAAAVPGEKLTGLLQVQRQSYLPLVEAYGEDN